VLSHKIVKVCFDEFIAVKFGDLSDDKSVDEFVEEVTLEKLVIDGSAAENPEYICLYFFSD